MSAPENRRPRDEIGRRVLAARSDPREVVTDPAATYVGAVLEDDTMVPLGDAVLGSTRLDDWMAR